MLLEARFPMITYNEFALDRSQHNMTSLACMDIPSLVPEVLTTQSGPFFIVQYLKGNHLLSALHSYSDTLSVCKSSIALRNDLACAQYQSYWLLQ